MTLYAPAMDYLIETDDSLDSLTVDEHGSEDDLEFLDGLTVDGWIDYFPTLDEYGFPIDPEDDPFLQSDYGKKWSRER